MNIQQHLEIQASVQQWVDNFMKNYEITATEMSDALTKVLLTLKDKVVVEYLTEMAQQSQSNAAAMPEDIQMQAPQEEEIDYGGETDNS